MDYIIDNKLNVYLLEINKGPSMNTIINKDYDLKYRLIENMFEKINLINTSKYDKKKYLVYKTIYDYIFYICLYIIRVKSI